MSFSSFVKPFASVGRRAANFWHRHGAAIQTGLSIGLGVGATVTACVATTKLEPIVDEHKEKIDNLKASHETMPDKCTDQVYRSELRKVYGHTAKEVAKLYWLPALLQVGSAVCSIGSYKMLSKENLAIGAAYVALDQAYKKVTGKVNAMPEEERKAVLIESKESSDEVYKSDEHANYDLDELAGFELSPYARIYNSSNPKWRGDSEHSLAYINHMEMVANDTLFADGSLYLEEVYKWFSFEPTVASHEVGWCAERNGCHGDGKVQFKVIALNGGDEYIIDFNVDGPIGYIYRQRI